MKYYLALTFSSQSLAWPQLESFSKRLETHPRSSRFEMAILPPFGHDSLLSHECDPIWEELSELVESHFWGLEDHALMRFSSLTWKGGGKSSFIGLGPELNEDWYHCQQELREVLLGEGFHFKKTKNRRKNPDADLEVKLPLAAFADISELHPAMELASSELQLPLTLRTDYLGLFEKTALGPRLMRKFFTFSPTSANLELERYSFAG
jgi:hypothetical protein